MTSSRCYSSGKYQELKGYPCQGEKSERVWPDEKFTPISHQSISITPFLKQDTRQKRGARLSCTQFWLVPFYQYLRGIDSFSLSEARWGGGGKDGGGNTTVALSLFPLPLEKGIPDREVGFISETAISCQVHGSRREKGYEQSHEFFVVQRRGKDLVQRGDVLAYA